MKQTLRIKIGVMLAVVSALEAAVALTLIDSVHVESFVLLAPWIMVSGVVGYLLAAQLLQVNRRRAYLSGAAMPLIVLAFYVLGLTVADALSRSLEGRYRAPSGTGFPLLHWLLSTAADFVLWIGVAMVFLGWVLCSLGILTTALIRDHWRDAVR